MGLNQGGQTQRFSIVIAVQAAPQIPRSLRTLYLFNNREKESRKKEVNFSSGGEARAIGLVARQSSSLVFGGIGSEGLFGRA